MEPKPAIVGIHFATNLEFEEFFFVDASISLEMKIGKMVSFFLGNVCTFDTASLEVRTIPFITVPGIMTLAKPENAIRFRQKTS